jgi:hypothetical protein
MPREPAAGKVAPPVPQHVWEHSFLEQERDRYVSRSLGYVVLLNGAAALALMAIVALNPESTSHRLAWAMLVFASGAIAGLLSSLLAYVRRLFAESLPTHVFLRDFLRVGAIVMAVGAGAAFLTGMNIVSLPVPEGSTTRMKSKPEENSKPQNPAPSPTGAPDRTLRKVHPFSRSRCSRFDVMANRGALASPLAAVFSRLGRCHGSDAPTN